MFHMMPWSRDLASLGTGFFVKLAVIVCFPPIFRIVFRIIFIFNIYVSTSCYFGECQSYNAFQYNIGGAYFAFHASPVAWDPKSYLSNPLAMMYISSFLKLKTLNLDVPYDA